MKKRINKILYNNVIISFLKRKKIKNIDVSIFDFLVEYKKSISSIDIGLRAKGIAFSFFMAIFPAIIFLFSIVPFIPIDNIDKYIMGFLKVSVPGNISDILKETIENIVNIKRGGILSIGFITTLYLVNNGVISIIKGLDGSEGGKVKLKDRYLTSFKISALVSLIMTVGMAIIAIIIVFILQYFKTHPELHQFRPLVIQIMSVIVIVVIFYLCMSSIFYYGKPRNVKWKFFNRGALLTSILMALTTYGFEEYVKHFSNYNKVYGSVGTLIMVMFWIFLNSVSLVLGYQLNLTIRKIKNKLL